MRISDWSSDVCSSDLSLFRQIPQQTVPMRERGLDRRDRHALVEAERAHHESPGVDAVRLLAGGAQALLGVEVGLHRGHDVLGDVVLDGENVLQLAVVLLGPDVLAGLGVDELNGDAQVPARRPHAALEDVAHAEIAGDLPDVHGLALVDETRIAGDHEEPRSEEHTSELQSLMRISYAVFCLKKKTNQIDKYNYPAVYIAT